MHNNLKKNVLSVYCALSTLTLFTANLETLNLKHCAAYHKPAPQSLTHEYIYDAPELAKQFKLYLGDNHARFLIGASTSEHQCSTQCTPAICDWSRFAEEKNLKKPTDEQYSCDLWKNYKTYIDQLKDKVGINALRISIEWALVQPEGPTSINVEVLDHYADLIAYLITKDITPVICFHHYTNPCWFADAGGFAKKKNCALFATYCTQTYFHIIDHLATQSNVYDKWMQLENSHRGILWATFNSPEGVAFKGYRQQDAPPSLKDKNGLYWVSIALKNLMESHVQAYQSINQITHHIGQNNIHIPKPKIGFLKNITQFDPAPGLSLLVKQITHLACAIANDLNNECIYNFFTTGTFCTKTPLTAASHYNALAPQSLDWIGLNYYSNQHMRLFGGRVIAKKTDSDRTDNNNYRIYPNGLCRALVEINQRLAQPLHIPIYVTENGIATQDHSKRNRFYKEYLHELLRAIQYKVPVHGYLTWTAFDNYEWPSTKNILKQSDTRTYGLTTVSPDGTVLTLKEGSIYFKTFATSLVSA